MTKNTEILLVEDTPDDIDLALRALKDHHITNPLTIIRDGAEALDFFFGTGAYTHRRVEDLPKLVLLDLKLPKVDGFEVLRQVRADPRTRTVPIVVLTSSREDRDIVASYQLGANSYIVKPVDFAQFTEAVRQLMLYWLLLNESPQCSR